MTSATSRYTSGSVQLIPSGLAGMKDDSGDWAMASFTSAFSKSGPSIAPSSSSMSSTQLEPPVRVHEFAAHHPRTHPSRRNDNPMAHSWPSATSSLGTAGAGLLAAHAGGGNSFLASMPLSQDSLASFTSSTPSRSVSTNGIAPGALTVGALKLEAAGVVLDELEARSGGSSYALNAARSVALAAAAGGSAPLPAVAAYEPLGERAGEPLRPFGRRSNLVGGTGSGTVVAEAPELSAWLASNAGPLRSSPSPSPPSPSPTPPPPPPPPPPTATLFGSTSSQPFAAPGTNRLGDWSRSPFPAAASPTSIAPPTVPPPLLAPPPPSAAVLAASLQQAPGTVRLSSEWARPSAPAFAFPPALSVPSALVVPPAAVGASPTGAAVSPVGAARYALPDRATRSLSPSPTTYIPSPTSSGTPVSAPYSPSQRASTNGMAPVAAVTAAAAAALPSATAAAAAAAGMAAAATATATSAMSSPRAALSPPLPPPPLPPPPPTKPAGTLRQAPPPASRQQVATRTTPAQQAAAALAREKESKEKEAREKELAAALASQTLTTTNNSQPATSASASRVPAAPPLPQSASAFYKSAGGAGGSSGFGAGSAITGYGGSTNGYASTNSYANGGKR